MIYGSCSGSTMNILQPLGDGKDSVVQALDELVNTGGGDPQGIAGHLRSEGISGRREDETSCPLAKWLSVRTGRDDLTINMESADTADNSYLLPRSLAAFVREFDNGAYPYLEVR